MLTIPGSGDQAGHREAAAALLRQHRSDWADDESAAFHLGHADIIRLLRSCGCA